MPVRSRGSLLAGTAALAGLIVAGVGCHSSPSDHDSFAIPNTPPQSHGSLLSRRGTVVMQAGYPAQPVIQNGLAPSFDPTARPVTLQPVPISQSPANNREVIASSWSPVQRVSSEQPALGTDSRTGAALVPVSMPQSSARISPMPIGSTMPAGNGPILDGADSVAPGSIMLPPPRPLGSLPSVVVYDGAAPPAHPFANVPREFEKMALPPYVVEPPDILLIQGSTRITLRLQAIQGQHLVGPDGTVNLGIYGKVPVAGLTLEQVADVVAARLLERLPGLLRGLPDIQDGKEVPNTDSEKIWKKEGINSVELIKKELQVDVLVYSSKFYYVITDGGGYGQQVYPIPIRGNETVLDALANINGLPAVASKRRVWVARATRAGQPQKILPVDWLAVTKCGESATNYQLFPGDRVYVDSNNLIKADSFLAKLYSPILRTFGVTLLGASTVNTIKLGTTSGVGATGIIR